MNLAQWLCDKPACEQCAPESAHCYRYYELDFSHCVFLRFLPLKVPEESVEGVVLGLCLESRQVFVDLGWVFHAGADGLSYGGELCLLCGFLLGVRMVLQVALPSGGAAALAFAPTAGDCGEFFFFAKDFA